MTISKLEAILTDQMAEEGTYQKNLFLNINEFNEFITEINNNFGYRVIHSNAVHFSYNTLFGIIDVYLVKGY